MFARHREPTESFAILEPRAETELTSACSIRPIDFAQRFRGQMENRLEAGPEASPTGKRAW